MEAHHPPSKIDDDLVWVAVSAERPCPVCGAATGCGVAEEEGFVLCRTRPSEHPLDVGGWLHARPRKRRRA
jgi:hypothetical protein